MCMFVICVHKKKVISQKEKKAMGNVLNGKLWSWVELDGLSKMFWVRNFQDYWKLVGKHLSFLRAFSISDFVSSTNFLSNFYLQKVHKSWDQSWNVRFDQPADWIFNLPEESTDDLPHLPFLPRESFDAGSDFCRQFQTIEVENGRCGRWSADSAG